TLLSVRVSATPATHLLSLHDALPICSRIGLPPMLMSALSPPPMRRAWPPASTRPRVAGDSIVMHRSFAPMLCALVRDRVEILVRSEEHTSELQSRVDLVCRLLLEKKK